MTKTKSQLRAEAVERLKNYERRKHRNLTRCILGDRYEDVSFEANRLMLIDLLTDDEPQDVTTPEFDVPLYGWHEGDTCGKLTAEQVRKAIFNGSSYASYDGAKYYADGINMQAIADELNATLDYDECSETALLPCPMCGSAFVQVRWIGFTHTHNGAFSAGYRGECCDCGLTTRAFDDEAEAIAAWNTRTTLGGGMCEFKPFADEDWSEPNTVRGVCSECAALMYGKDNFCPNCGARVRKKVGE